MLLEAVFGVARSRLAVVLLVAAVLIARILIAEIILSPAEWSALLSRLRVRAAVVACFVSIVIIRALEPFTFTSVPRPFGWIPFLSVLRRPGNQASASSSKKSSPMVR